MEKTNNNHNGKSKIVTEDAEVDGDQMISCPYCKEVMPKVNFKQHFVKKHVGKCEYFCNFGLVDVAVMQSFSIVPFRESCFSPKTL